MCVFDCVLFVLFIVGDVRAVFVLFIVGGLVFLFGLCCCCFFWGGILVV